MASVFCTIIARDMSPSPSVIFPPLLSTSQHVIWCSLFLISPIVTICAVASRRRRRIGDRRYRDVVVGAWGMLAGYSRGLVWEVGKKPTIAIVCSLCNRSSNDRCREGEDSKRNFHDVDVVFLFREADLVD